MQSSNLRPMSRPSSDGSSGSESNSSSDSEGSSSDESIPELEKQQDTEPKVEGSIKKNNTSKSSPESSLWYENIPPLITGKQRGAISTGNHSLIEGSSSSDSSSSSGSDSDSDTDDEDSRTGNNLRSNNTAKSSFQIRMSYTQALDEKNRAAQLLADYAEKNKPKTSGSDRKWLESMLRNGTLSDKVAAMALLIQQSPVTSLSTIDQLLNMTKKQQSREALLSVEAARDLFLSNLLPDRKLRRFHENNLDPNQISDLHRVYFYFEDCIK